MKKTKIILFFLMLTWLITNAADCGGGGNPEPEPCTKENTIKFPQDALDRFYFKEGSYWVYTDSASKTMYDSVWVYYNAWGASSKNDNGSFKNKCYDGGGSFQDGLSLKTKINVSFGAIPPIEEDVIDYIDETFRVVLLNLTDGTSRVTRFILTGDNYSSLIRGQVSFHDSIEINSTTYKDILKLHYPSQHSDFLNDGYWAKNVGLIKYTDLNGTVWELTKSQTIQ